MKEISKLSIFSECDFLIPGLIANKKIYDLLKPTKHGYTVLNFFRRSRNPVINSKIDLIHQRIDESSEYSGYRIPENIYPIYVDRNDDTTLLVKYVRRARKIQCVDLHKQAEFLRNYMNSFSKSAGVFFDPGMRNALATIIENHVDDLETMGFDVPGSLRQLKKYKGSTLFLPTFSGLEQHNTTSFREIFNKFSPT